MTIKERLGGGKRNVKKESNNYSKSKTMKKLRRVKRERAK